MVVAAVAAAGGSAWVASAVVRGVWLALAGAVGALGAVWSAQASMRREFAVALNTKAARDLRLEDGRLPRLGRCVDPVTMRVHPAAALEDDPDDRVPVFVPRDVSVELVSALTPGCFVLVVGDSTAGKTRAAFEAIRTLRGPWRVIEPMDRAAVDTAVRVAQQSRWPCVVWLDDLERFLGTGGITRAHLEALRHGRARDHCVVATMRAEEYARITRAGGRRGELASAQPQGRDVLVLARQIRLARKWSSAEVERARTVGASDPRVREAVARSDTFGIGEYLAAGPELLHDWQDAWAPGAHPRGAALVAAGVLARRCGIHRPLPEPVLSRAAQPYLAARGGMLLRPELLAEALEWATAPLHATSSLLRQSEDSYLAFDYLIDALPKTAPPPDALEALITVATLDEVVDLGDLAYGWRLHDQVEHAFQRVVEHPKPEQRDRAIEVLAATVDERCGPARAWDFLAEMVHERTERLGVQHPDALAARLAQTYWMELRGDRVGALSVCQSLLPLVERAEGPDAWRTLIVRRAIAWHHAGLGQWETAAREYQKLAEDWSRVEGPDSRWAVSCRVRGADVLGDAQEPAAAASALHTVLSGFDEHVDPEMRRYAQRALACWLEESGRYPEAAAMWREQLADSEHRDGAEHTETLHLRRALARCVGHGGDPRTAVSMLQDVLRIHTESGQDPEGSDALRFRRALATWIGMAGDPGQAATRLRELTELAARHRGENDPLSLGCRSRAADWIAATGEIDRGIAQLESTLPLLEAVLGPLDKETRTCRERLDFWRSRAHAPASTRAHA